MGGVAGLGVGVRRELVIGLVAVVAIVAAYCQGRASVEPAVIPIPRITTVYDTVRELDIRWRDRPTAEARTDTFRVIERVTVTVPETVLVDTGTWRGIQFVSVPVERGDSMLIEGATVVRDSAGTLTQRQWRVQAWTAGPLRLISLDSFPPRLSFWPPPTPARSSRCGAGVAAGYAVLSQSLDAVIGFACRVELPVLPWPF